MKISEMIRGSSMREAAAPLSAWIDQDGGDAEVNAREWGKSNCKDAAKTLLKLDATLQKASDFIKKEMKEAGVNWRVFYLPSVGNISQDYSTAWIHIGARGSDGKKRWLPDEIEKMKEILAKIAKLRNRPEYHG